MSMSSFGQSKDSWIRFYDTITNLSGYKDLKGDIKIPAKFKNFTRADTFYNIIAVAEKVDSSWKEYYLLKNGRKVGEDSVFMFDFTYDCESEGKILFKDKKKDRVGFFDKNGIVTIPAIYNAASPFRNGLSIALKNAERKNWGEHWGWVGGETVLINEKNEVLVDSLKEDLNNINWYSLKTNDPNVDTSIWISIKGVKGKTYSFINYQKEFTKWFYSKFLLTLNASNYDKLKELLFAENTFWTNDNGWVSLSNDEFLKKFPSSITKERFQETNLKTLSISDEDLNYLIFDGNLYKVFFNSCGSHNKEKYPAFDVILTYYKKRLKKLTMSTDNNSEKEALSDYYNNYEIAYQEHFVFIRTMTGYKLLSVSLKN